MDDNGLKGEVQGSCPLIKDPAGREMLAGRQPCKSDGYDTSYLWEEVLTKDTLMTIIHRYMHLD